MAWHEKGCPLEEASWVSRLSLWTEKKSLQDEILVTGIGGLSKAVDHTVSHQSLGPILQVDLSQGKNAEGCTCLNFSETLAEV